MPLEHVGREEAAAKQAVRPGAKFGWWTVLSVERKRHPRAVCRCACGTERSLDASSLRKGQSKSCGCERIAAIRAARTTHGGSRSSEYKIWDGMKRRCSDPSAPHYERYGGRGIKVCQRWQESFAAFMEDMGPRPDGTSIDRENGDGDYEPSNCRWATAETQQNNRANNRFATLDGRTQTVAQWARELGVRPGTVKYRAERDGVLHDRGVNPTKEISK